MCFFGAGDFKAVCDGGESFRDGGINGTTELASECFSFVSFIGPVTSLIPALSVVSEDALSRDISGIKFGIGGHLVDTGELVRIGDFALPGVLGDCENGNFGIAPKGSSVFD